MKWIAHLEDHMSKLHMIVAIPNKEAVTVARVLHQWITAYGIPDILQSDNGTEFKGVCLELAKNHGIKIINGRPCTP